jgi:tetratricopeptide (TPR) repeat protein
MHAGQHDEETCDVSEADARFELERLLADPRFHGTERARCILRYLAERHFDGCDDGVKAYSIALDVLGRPSSFDAASDPIVRIEMSRLRSSLSQYYEAFGDESVVAIHLPKGRYLAAFAHSTGLAEPAHEKKGEFDGLSRRPVMPGKAAQKPAPEFRQNRWFLPVVAGLATCAVLCACAVWYGRGPAFADKPTVSVVMSAADQRLRGEADTMRDALLTALTQFQTLKIASEAPPDKSLSSALRGKHDNTYEIELKYYADDNDRSIWWQIVDTRSGALLKSGLETVNTDGRTAAALRNDLVTVLSRRFAATRGIINNIETLAGTAGALGNACVLRAEYNLDDGSPEDLLKASDCLEKTIAAEPANADAVALLSRVLTTEVHGDRDVLLSRSLDLANRAVSLSPFSDRAQIALMVAQFLSGRAELAIASGNRALEINPNNPEAAAKLGMVLFASGYWDAAVSLAQDASHAVDAVPRDARLVLALDAYRRGDFSDASLLAEQINRSDLVVAALRAASLGQLHSLQAAERLADLRKINPDFEQTFASAMASRNYQPTITASLEDGLALAGAQFSTASIK